MTAMFLMHLYALLLSGGISTVMFAKWMQATTTGKKLLYLNLWIIAIISMLWNQYELMKAGV